MAQQSIKINAVVNTLRTISTMIFPLITFPYTSRILGPEGIGKVNFATSFLGYFILFASIGIPMYGIRAVAKVRDDKNELSNVSQELFVMHLAISLISLLGFLSMIFINKKIYDEKSLFILVSSSIVLSTMGLNWLYQGLEQYIYITVRSIVFSTISTVAIFLLIKSKNDYLLYAGITIFSSLGSSVLNFYNARKILLKKRIDKWQFKRHLKSMFMVYGMTFIGSLYLQLDTIMLGFMSTARNVGYYTASIKLTKMVMGIIISFSDVLLPRLSYYLANNLKHEFDRMLSKSFAINLLITIPTVISMMILSEEIILVFAGKEYLSAIPSVIITAPIILFIGLTYIIGIQIFYSMGEDKKMVISFSLAALASLVLNYFLIPRYAHIGAAIATLLAEFVVLIAQIIMLSKVYKLEVPYRSILKYIVGTLFIVTMVYILKLYVSIVWLRLLIAVPTGIVIYFSVLIVLKEAFVKDVLSGLLNRTKEILKKKV